MTEHLRESGRGKALASNYDYVIVGAGSAGCVVARRLVDGTDATVLLLEAGGPGEGPSLSDPPRWVEAGNPGWDFNSVLPLFKKSEHWEDGASEFRGAGGPIRVERARDHLSQPEARISPPPA
jgi:choline dehydrogenase